jgi:hypothetical protein
VNKLTSYINILHVSLGRVSEASRPRGSDLNSSGITSAGSGSPETGCERLHRARASVVNTRKAGLNIGSGPADVGHENPPCYIYCNFGYRRVIITANETRVTILRNPLNRVRESLCCGPAQRVAAPPTGATFQRQQ